MMRAGCIHLCRVTANTVWSHRQVTLCSFHAVSEQQTNSVEPAHMLPNILMQLIQSNSLIKYSLTFNVLPGTPADLWRQAINRGHSGRATQRSWDYATTWPDSGTEISVHAEFSHCRQNWYYGLQAMYSSIALKSEGPSIWDNHCQKVGVRIPRPHCRGRVKVPQWGSGAVGRGSGGQSPQKLKRIC